MLTPSAVPALTARGAQGVRPWRSVFFICLALLSFARRLERWPASRKRHEDPGGQRHRGPGACRSAVPRIVSHSRTARARSGPRSVAESPCMHIRRPTRAESLAHERPGHPGSPRVPWQTDSAGRVVSTGRREVEPSNRGHAIGRNEAHYAEDDSEEGDEQRCRSHVFSVRTGVVTTAILPARWCSVSTTDCPHHVQTVGSARRVGEVALVTTWCVTTAVSRQDRSQAVAHPSRPSELLNGSKHDR